MKRKLLLLLMLLPLAANAYDAYIDGIYYNFSEDEAIVTYNERAAGIDYTGDIVIPKSVTYNDRTYYVTNIGDFAFYNCEGVTNITLPSGIKNICTMAFCNCTSLISINLPESIKIIDAYAFASCSGLTSINIPLGVTTIGVGAFGACTGLNSITVPESVTTIGNNAFSDCTGELILKKQPIPAGEYTGYNHEGWDGVKCSPILSGSKFSSIKVNGSVGNYAFAHLSTLQSIEIGENGGMADRAFYDCTATTLILNCTLREGTYNSSFLKGTPFKYITVNTETIPKYSFSGLGMTSLELGEKVKVIGEGAFLKCSMLSSIIIPPSVTFIGEEAFRECHGLTSICIPNSMTEIGTRVFYDCISTNTVISSNPVPPPCAEDAFGGLNGGHTYDNSVLYVPRGSINLYKATSPWSSFSDIQPITTEYNLTYMVDGEVYKSFEIEYNATITPEPAPTKEGYTFSGWSEIPETMPAEDVTVTGTFIINQYTISFDTDGGSPIGGITLDYGSAITPPENPTKEGYTFIGWEPVIPETMPLNGLTVKAQWQINSYTLTYRVDGEEYMTLNVVYGTELTPEEDPSKEGYTFSGWNGLPATMPAHDVVVTGTFSINSYTLTYKVNGEVYKTYGVEYGATITPEPAPTKDGFTFSGWSEIPATMPAHDVVVTGSFIAQNYTLTYIVDGQVYKTYSIACGAAITPEEAPIKEGYTFSGWTYIPATMPATNVVVMGTFTINSYNLTYLVDGEEYKTSTVVYGTEIVPEEEPSKEGYTFSGWSEIPATMPAQDVVVTGSFTINTHTLSYIVDGEVYKTYEVEYGSAITPEAEPTKAGYSFSGWSEIPETMPDHDVEVTGSFTMILATSIALDKESLLFNSFDAQKLNVTLTPDNLFNKTVLWSSSDTDIATVDEDGLVTPINNGEAIITVCTTDGTGLEASCKVTVDFKATALGLDKVNLLITELKSQQLTAYITPAKARFEVAWSSSNESIVTVSETGNITPLRNGEATITVATTDGTDLSSTCLVTVNIPSQFEVVATQTTLAIQSRSGEAEAQNINVTIEGTTYNLSDVEKLTGLAPGTTYHLEVNAVIDGYNWTEEMDVTMAEIAVNFDGKTSPTTLDINASYDAGDATIISAGFEGEEEEVSTLSLNGLDPGQTYDFTYSINTEEGGTYTYKAQFTTEALTLEISRTKVVQVGDVVVVAGSNITEEENVQVGFEWRRYDWPDEIQTKAGAAFIYAGTIEGSIKNLNADKFWKIRPYFLSQAGNRYWGDWVTVDPSDASYFEPSVHTYNSVSIEDNTAEVKGFVMQGSDDVEQQGFMYWTASPQSSSRRNANGVPSDAKVVEANGNMMVASLKDLEYETEYSYVAFVKTSGGETFYGEKQTFTTGEMDPDGIKEIESLTPALSKGEGVWYSLDGKKLSKPQRGINIINGKKIAIK